MIARRVAADRVISTVDPDARHGRKTTARRFDGYKGHTAVDPDSELVTATAVTPANTADAQPAPELIEDLLNTDAEDTDTADTADTDAEDGGVVEEFAGRPTVYGDRAYGSGEFQGLLQQSRINSRCRTQPAAAPGGRFTKDSFEIDLLNGTVTCPDGTTVAVRARSDGSGTASFGAACHKCALRSRQHRAPRRARKALDTTTMGARLTT